MFGNAEVKFEMGEEYNIPYVNLEKSYYEHRFIFRK